jgi:hemerythrin
MPIRWDPKLAVGIQEIDEQHQELFVRAGRVLAAMRAADLGETERTLGLLGDHLVLHFAAEEAWMRSSIYPDYSSHQAEHDRFLKEFRRLKTSFEAKGFVATVTVMIQGWLGAWLRAHIAGTDRKLAAHLLKHRQVLEAVRI